MSTGCSRLVVRAGPWAVKLPNFRWGWTAFLRGLLHNMNEAGMWRWGNMPAKGRATLCPILFACPGGWFLVMPWAEPLGRDEHHDILPEALPWGDERDRSEMLKADNVGRLADGRWVVVDYAGAA